MNREEMSSKIEEAINQFEFEGNLIDKRAYGSGHINDTFKLQFDIGADKPRQYILQRMNNEIFKDPVQLVGNISGVTSHLRKKIIENGGDPERETLNLIPTKNHKVYYQDSIGMYWRAYKYVEGAITFDIVEKPEHFYQSAVAFGNFQRLLADYPAHTLHETIVDFHHTPKRFRVFEKAVAEDVCGRAKDVKAEIDFIMARKDEVSTLVDMLAKGELPLRVTHNDTKLNNVMIDIKTEKGLCVIDLDTVMPGLAVNDFGDSIRFGASTGEEDEPDLSKVWLNLELFDSYAKGFIKATGGSLTKAELDMMPTGAKMMTFECGMRFLTDHLQGDHYFRIHRENHNLDRARTQLKLVADMEAKWNDMQAIITKYR